jgi:hypothetical protein
MTLADPALPYGLRDVKLTPINSDDSLGTSVDLPVSQTLSFSEAEEFEELRGDDRLVAIHGKGPTVNFDIEAGGISLEAWHVLTGGTLDNTGVTPSQTKSLLKNVSQSRPYFKIEGQSINDVDGDTHVVIYKAKVTDTLEGEFADGGFFITKCSGQGLGNEDGDLYKITWNETEAGITAGVNELQQVIVSATGGTYTITYSAQTTGNITAGTTTLAQITTLLEALSNIAPGDVALTGDISNYVIEFKGTLAATNVAQVTLTVGSLTGGSAAVATIRAGAPAS